MYWNRTKQRQELCFTLLCAQHKLYGKYHKRKKFISVFWVILLKVVLQNEKKKRSILFGRCQWMSVFSNFPWLLFRMISAFLSAQLFLSQKIYCLSDNFIILPYAVSRLHDLLQEFFFCLWFLPIGFVLYVVTVSIRGAWDLVSLQAKPMDGDEYDTKQ